MTSLEINFLFDGQIEINYLKVLLLKKRKQHTYAHTRTNIYIYITCQMKKYISIKKFSNHRINNIESLSINSNECILNQFMSKQKEKINIFS